MFNKHYDNEIKPDLAPRTLSKIEITGAGTHPELIESFNKDSLPKIYGGNCECEASCIFSDKGPWTDVENKVNYFLQ